MIYLKYNKQKKTDYLIQRSFYTDKWGSYISKVNVQVAWAWIWMENARMVTGLVKNEKNFCKRNLEKIMIKNMLKRRKENNYLATFVDMTGVHRWRWKKIINWSFQPALWLSSAEEEDVEEEVSHSAGWKLQLIIFFHRHLCTRAMSMNSSQVGVALFPSF